MSKVLINVVYAFTPLDIENPTKDFRRFLRDLTGYLEGETDKSGSSEADHMYDVDMGGGGAGAPAFPAGAALAGEMQRLRLGRSSRVYAALYKYIPSHDIHDVFDQQYRGNGRGAFLYVEGLYDRTITPGEMYRLRAEWNALSIVSHVGIAADSISSFAILLERKNQEFPLLSRHNETEKAEKMLVSIAEASSHFSEGALNELNRAAGSRLFEHPAPAVPVAFAGGAIPAGLMAVPLPFHHRDITALIAHYREQWRAAMGPNGPLTAAPARRAVRGAEGANLAMAGRDEFALAATHNNKFSMSQSARCCHDAGWRTERGCCTTTDFNVLGSEELAQAVHDGCCECFSKGNLRRA
jgi:hypothetical protein